MSNKIVNTSFRIEPELKEAFQYECDMAFSNMSEVVEGLMRGYVMVMKGKRESNEKKDK